MVTEAAAASASAAAGAMAGGGVLGRGRLALALVTAPVPAPGCDGRIAAHGEAQRPSIESHGNISRTQMGPGAAAGLNPPSLFHWHPSLSHQSA